MAERREAAAVDSDDAINVGGAVLAVLGINSAWGIRVGGGPSVWLLLNSPVLFVCCENVDAWSLLAT